MKFTSKLFLPILKKEVRYCQLNNFYYFELLKFITNNDEDGLCDYFEWLLSELIHDKNVLFELTNVEKFLILLDIRSIGMGDTLQLKGINNLKIDYRISTIKNNILNKLKETECTRFIDYNDIFLDLSIPKALKIDNIDTVYKEIINKIKVDKEIVNYYLLTDSEKESIMSLIPAKITSEMMNFINFLQNLCKDINIINGNSKIGLEKVPLNFFDKTFFYFLKSIYTDDLMNYYEMQYNLISKMNVSYDHFMQMSPNECKLYINFYNAEKKRQQEAESDSSPKFR